jgi:hypothetical protein
MSDRAVEHLLANCAEPERKQPRPVLERLRDLLGSDLTRLLLFGLARQRGRGSSAP